MRSELLELLRESSRALNKDLAAPAGSRGGEGRGGWGLV